MAIGLPLKHNLRASAAPTATDDSRADYARDSRWVDRSTCAEYVCVDPTPGQAIWLLNPNAGIEGVAGLTEALGAVATLSRTALVERFEQVPSLAASIDPETAADPSQAEIDAIFAANRNFEVAGTNMTAALCTQNVARGGVRLTSAGAEADQCILQPRTNPAGVSRWTLGFLSDGSPFWALQFNVPDWELLTFKAALALTNAHNLTTDADQVGLWYDGSVTPEDEGPPVVPEFITEPNFRVVWSAGGTDVEIDTGIAPENGREYLLTVTLDANRRAEVRLNGLLVGISGVLVTAKTLKPFVSIEALEGAAKIIDVRHEAVAMNAA